MEVRSSPVKLMSDITCWFLVTKLKSKSSSSSINLFSTGLIHVYVKN